ncbi:DUF3606 domain-containing protein [Polaromonas sp. P5_D5]
MANTDKPQSHAGEQPARINLNDKATTAEWLRKLDVTQEQLREAVAAVGDKATNVEMHLKGARSTTNADRVRELSTHK